MRPPRAQAALATDPRSAGTSWQQPAAAGRPRAGAGGRWGLVLGGGGVLGASWLVGAVEALERVRGVDVRDAELIVGTSAGSVIGSLLAAGLSAEDLRAHQLGERRVVGPLGAIDDGSGPIGDTAGGPSAQLDVDASPAGRAYPPRPRLAPGNARMITRNARRLRRMPPTAVLSGLVPAGRGSLPAVRRLIESVVPPGQWAGHPGLRVAAFDYDTGRRVLFGEPGAPAAGLSDAVLASCSIPGWYAPVLIDGTRYVDGGTWSATNADLLAGHDLDEVIVLAPMVSLAYDDPVDRRVRLERRWRSRVTHRCLGETRALTRQGTGVTVLGPGPEDLRLMGHNLMAPGPRRDVLETSLRTSAEALGGGRVIDLDRAEQRVDRIIDLDAADAPTTEPPTAVGGAAGDGERA